MDRYSSSLGTYATKLQYMAQQSTATYTEGLIAKQLASEEVAARKALLATAPGLPKEVLPNTCIEHKSQLHHRTIDQSVLYNRSLMPLCRDCVYKYLARSTPLAIDNLFGHMDSCTCASQVLAKGRCVWCAIEVLNHALDTYESEHTEYVEGIRALRCRCGNKPMLEGETLRWCSGCSGVVTVPLHGLDNTTHLACMIGRRSEMFGGPEVTNLLGSPVPCTVHPVQPLTGITTQIVKFPQYNPGDRSIGSDRAVSEWQSTTEQEIQQQQYYGGLPPRR